MTRRPIGLIINWVDVGRRLGGGGGGTPLPFSIYIYIFFKCKSLTKIHYLLPFGRPEILYPPFFICPKVHKVYMTFAPYAQKYLTLLFEKRREKLVNYGLALR